AMLALYGSFHLVTFATIGIIFLPHLVAMLVFVPLERLAAPWRRPPAASERSTPSALRQIRVRKPRDVPAVPGMLQRPAD
ncbi:MAG TPA: hypothetical protein VGR26_01280, partial [Acidimicrobiales bacterium]|nr:hypothetical protein [Acidimicrobiales bacterium]